MNALRFALGWSLGIAFIGLWAEITILLIATHHPRVRARFWQVVLFLALGLPAFYLTPTPGSGGGGPIGAFFIVAASSAGTRLQQVPATWATYALWAWAVVAIIQMVRVARSLGQLAALTRNTRPVAMGPEDSRYRVVESAQIETPSASFLGRVILVPASFSTLPDYWRRAVITHEAIHLDRRHGVALLFEEIVRSLFWFHPIMGRLVVRVRAAREELVDADTVDLVGDPGEYRSMLIALATKSRALSPAISGAEMLRTRIHSLNTLETYIMPSLPVVRVLCASLTLLGSTVSAYEIASAATRVAPEQETGSKKAEAPPRKILSKVNPVFPEALKARKVNGLVVLSLTVDAAGTVTDAAARPADDPECAKAAIAAIRQWKFEPAAKPTKMTYAFSFRAGDDKDPK